MCYPADAIVRFRDGTKRVEDLRLFDECLDHRVQYSEVFLETHRDATSIVPHMQITTENKHTVRLSSRHYLFVNGRYVPARDARKGDELETALGRSKVVHIETRHMRGAFNPYTRSGALMVDDVHTSCMSESFMEKYVSEAYVPAVWHAILSPLYVLRMASPSRWTKYHEVMGGRELSGVPLCEQLYAYFGSQV